MMNKITGETKMTTYKISKENLKLTFKDTDGKNFAVVSELKDGIAVFTGKSEKFSYGVSMFDSKIKLEENAIVYFTSDGAIEKVVYSSSKATAYTARSGCNFDKSILAERL